MVNHVRPASIRLAERIGAAHADALEEGLSHQDALLVLKVCHDDARMAVRHTGLGRKVALAAAQMSGVGFDDVMGPATDHAISHPRQVAMFVLLVKGGMTAAQIGRVFGRDSSTVFHARRSVERRLMRGCDATTRLSRRLSEFVETAKARSDTEARRFEHSCR